MKKKSLQTIRQIFSELRKKEPKLIWATGLEILFSRAGQYIPLLLFVPVIDHLINQHMIQFLAYGLLYLIIQELCSLFAEFFHSRSVILGRKINALLLKDIHLQPLVLDYETVTEPKFRDTYAGVIDEMNFECDYYDVISMCKDATENLISAAASAVLAAALFLQTPVTGNKICQFFALPLTDLILMLFLLTATILFIQNYSSKINTRQEQYFKKHSGIERSFAYIRDKIVYRVQDYPLFHIYDMNDILADKIQKNADENVAFFHRNRILSSKKELAAGAALGLITVSAYFITILKVSTGAIPVAALLTYSQALILLSKALLNITTVWNRLKRQLPYFEDIYNFMNQTSCVSQKSGLSPQLQEENTWTFCDVSYQYPGREGWAVKDLNLTISSAYHTALVGRNGSGKTTIILLMAGLLTPKKGKILFNGVNIQSYSKKEYWKTLSVVFQDFCIYPGTLDENIAAGLAISPEKLAQSLQNAGLNDLAPEKKSFSGGENQRIAIARAFYKESCLLITDEPTAALDPVGEADIYLQIQKESLHTPTVFITHRMSSCKMCGKILVIKDGSLVQSGNHETLLKEHGEYKVLWEMQKRLYSSEYGTADIEKLFLSSAV